MPFTMDIPDPLRARLGDEAGKQRAMVAEDHLLLVLHKVPQRRASQREGVLFSRAPDGRWTSSTGGSLESLRQHLTDYASAVDAVEADLAKAQRADDFFNVLEAITPIYRAAKNQHYALQSARELLPQARDLITMRDMAADVERESELLQAEAKYALDYYIAKQAEEHSRLEREQTRASRRLNVLAAIFLPITAISGVFNTTIRSGLENGPASVFWMLFGLSVLLGVAIVLWITSMTKPQ